MYQGANRLKEVQPSKIRLTTSRANELAMQGKDVIRFSTGEPNFNTPSLIKQATIQAIEDNYTHYGSNAGDLNLKKEIAKNVKVYTGVDYDPDQEILITSGGSEAINHVMLALVNPGDEVIVLTPAFLSYENMVHMSEGKFIEIPLKSENQFQLDLEAIEKAITNKTKMIVINNPCNPTGALYPREDLEKLSQIIIKNDLYVFSDEIYNQLVYDHHEVVSLASFPNMKERTIMMNGFSKTYAMTGWRLAYMCAPKAIIQDLLKVHQYATTCAPTFIQVGLAKSMNQEQTLLEVKQMIQTFNQRRLKVKQALQEMKLDFVEPEGAFYFFIDVSSTPIDGETFSKRLLEEEYVAVIPGNAFGSMCKNNVRLSYAASDEDIERGMQRMKRFVDKIRKGG